MRERQRWLFPDGRRGTELPFLCLVLFSFPVGSEVLFGLVSTVLVYKHDFCSMGTRTLLDMLLTPQVFVLTTTCQ